MTAHQAGAWVRQAWHDSGRRDLAAALLIALFLLLFGPHGGAFLTTFREGVDPIFDPGKAYVRGFVENTLSIGLPLVFAIRVANLAIADRVPAWLAYGLALLATGLCAHAFKLLPVPRVADAPLYPAEIAWTYLVIFLDGAIGLVIYARWRAAQRAMRLVLASEAERARNAQRLQSARLLALQARVDPQLLFDTLGRVGILQRHDQAAADALLADLIALLRAMLPSATATGSSVEREFAVVDAWLRVTGATSDTAPAVRWQVAPATAGARLAPMLALPLLRAALDVPGARAIGWHLGADAAGGRLLISLSAPGESPERAAAVLDRVELGPLRERLALLHGDAAHVWLARTLPAITLDLPHTPEDADEPLPAAVAVPAPIQELSHALSPDR